MQVQEFFGDFVVIDPHHFALPLGRPHVALQPFNWDYSNATDAVSRMTEGLASLMLSLRRRFAIRCTSTSPPTTLRSTVHAVLVACTPARSFKDQLGVSYSGYLY